ncbi:MAG: DUF2269 family protein [Thermoleophilia bacterium]
MSPADRHDLALFLHLLGVVAMLSGIVVAAVAHGAARRRSTAAEVAALLGAARTGVLLAGPGALVVVGSGAWLVDLLGIGYGAGWLSAALALLAAALVLGALGGRAPKRARLLAEQHAAARQPVSPQLRALLDDRPSRLLNHASALLMIGVLALMVFKP